MLTSVQKEILQSLINLYRESKCTSVKGESIAELMGRNSGTIRNQMQALRSLGLVKGVPGPRGGYKPTLDAYQLLHIEDDPCEIHIPMYINEEPISDLAVTKIEFPSLLKSAQCEATISVLGDIKQVDLDDNIKIGPTPVNNLIVEGVVVGRDDVDNVLLLKTGRIQSIPSMNVMDIATKDVITINPESNLSEVAKILINNNIRGAPVVLEDDILGVIMLEDLTKMIAEGVFDITAREFMHENVITASDDITLMRTIDILYQNRISLLVLLDKTNKMSGVITFYDILNEIANFN